MEGMEDMKKEDFYHKDREEHEDRKVREGSFLPRISRMARMFFLGWRAFVPKGWVSEIGRFLPPIRQAQGFQQMNIDGESRRF